VAGFKKKRGGDGKQEKKKGPKKIRRTVAGHNGGKLERKGFVKPGGGEELFLFGLGGHVRERKKFPP